LLQATKVAKNFGGLCANNDQCMCK